MAPFKDPTHCIKGIVHCAQCAGTDEKGTLYSLQCVMVTKVPSHVWGAEVATKDDQKRCFHRIRNSRSFSFVHLLEIEKYTCVGYYLF